MLKFNTQWETDQSLTLYQREVQRFLEEVYLSQKHSKKERTEKFYMDVKPKQYIMWKDSLFLVVSETDDFYLCQKGSIGVYLPKDKVEKNRKVWRCLVC